jgi:hypothetical protein
MEGTGAIGVRYVMFYGLRLFGRGNVVFDGLGACRGKIWDT